MSSHFSLSFTTKPEFYQSIQPRHHRESQPRPACQAPLSSGPYYITETLSAHLSVAHVKAKTLSCSGLKA